MIYEMNFDERGLTPLVVSGLEIGDAVRHANNGNLFWVIDQDEYGYTIANLSGEQRHGQRLGTLSPHTRIEKDSEQPKISMLEVETLKALVERKRESDRIAADKAKQQHAAERDAAIDRIKAEFPKRVSDDVKISAHARAAKNIRLQLKALFPSTKFTVRSKSYSMGDSVDVSWTLGPSDAEVSAIVDRYQYGNFDGMNDIYEYDQRAESQAFHSVMGSTKYAFASRDIPNEFRQQVINDIRARYATPPADHELARQAYQAINPVSLYGKEYDGVECSGGRHLIKVR